jgi:ribosome-associated heat shock protein Hsp15
MRIDKFLWSVRVFKTRSLSGELIKANRVEIDNAPIKPSREVKLGDVIRVKRHGFSQEFKVLAMPKSRVSAKLVEQFIEDITPQVEVDKEVFLKLARNMTRQKGLGRPTKKDRRNIDDFLD